MPLQQQDTHALNQLPVSRVRLLVVDANLQQWLAKIGHSSLFKVLFLIHQQLIPIDVFKNQVIQNVFWISCLDLVNKAKEAAYRNRRKTRSEFELYLVVFETLLEFVLGANFPFINNVCRVFSLSCLPATLNLSG